jgi:hypothetical protein
VDRCGDGNVSGGDVAGVEDDVAGLEHGDVGAGAIGADGVGAAGDFEDVERDCERGGSGGRCDVEGVEVDEVTTPGDDRAGWASGTEDQAGEVVDRATGQVLAWDPLRVGVCVEA